MRKKISPMKVSRFFAQVSLDRLSYLTGIEKSKLSRIENGWIIPADRERQRIARALRAKEDELFPQDKSRMSGPARSLDAPALSCGPVKDDE